MREVERRRFILNHRSPPWHTEDATPRSLQPRVRLPRDARSEAAFQLADELTPSLALRKDLTVEPATNDQRRRLNTAPRPTSGALSRGPISTRFGPCYPTPFVSARRPAMLRTANRREH